ncbi:hypothetical protein [Aureibaculum luteum]|uniref:hypothetical protein n=1 Tax=Aureibaculum luteum TaxID=1548456 RepID=UPI0013001921|nr:hypothetical protein [Aureibaculum luteum]
MKLKYINILFLNCLFLCSLQGQKILIDQGIQADGLLCFPVYKQPNTFKYLPLNAGFSLTKEGLPTFSYMRYIIEKPTKEESSNSITKADGGGILHFLVQYNTPVEKIAEAKIFLQKKFNTKDIKISGPIQFNKGRYTMVSSILNSKSGKKEKRVIESGETPITERTNLAATFNVDPLKSKLLLESLKMATSDVSLVFELSFSGLTDSYEAEVDIDWSEIKKSKKFDAGGSAYFIGADIGLAFDSMRRDNVIKLTSVGSDSAMESLVQTIYDKLIGLMFTKVPLEQVSEENKGGIEESIGALIGPNGALGSRNTTGFGFNVAYKHKEYKTTGKSHLVFKGRSDVNRTHFITFNMGSLYKEYGSNQNIFKEVPLWDPTFQQREIFIGLDGDVKKEFEKMINSVTIKMKKQHQDGTETIKEVFLTKDTYLKKDGKVGISYLNHKDTDIDMWLTYQYQSIWKFVGGGSYSSDWKKQSTAMINLFVPFNRKTIEIMGELETLRIQNIVATSINISYDFFGEKRNERVKVFPSDTLSEKSFEVTLPRGQDTINYSMMWFVKGEQPIKKAGINTHGILFIDEIPKE